MVLITAPSLPPFNKKYFGIGTVCFITPVFFKFVACILRETRTVMERMDGRVICEEHALFIDGEK